jgi:hypothetical protein
MLSRHGEDAGLVRIAKVDKILETGRFRRPG